MSADALIFAFPRTPITGAIPWAEQNISGAQNQECLGVIPFGPTGGLSGKKIGTGTVSIPAPDSAEPTLPARFPPQGSVLDRPAGICTGTVSWANPGAVRKSQQNQILHIQGPSGPGRNRTQALLILRAGNEAPTKQEGVPRNGVRGKATMGTKCPSEPSPAAFWLLCRRGQSNPLSADSGIPPVKIYGPLITLGLQNHFHSRQPR